jgi:hypothetical protein
MFNWKKYARYAVVIILIICGFTVLNKVNRMNMRRSAQKAQHRKQKICAQIPSDETIFVSIASYRDPDCPNTVFDCFEKAACPLRIRIGVCQQNTPRDLDVVQGYRKLYQKAGTGNYETLLRVLRMEAGQARGPMYARSEIEQKLYSGEKYYLIIDSHTCFEPDWDVHLIDMLKRCPSTKPILTMYPTDFHHHDTAKGWKKPTSNTAENLQPPAFLRLKQFHPVTSLAEIEGPIMHTRPSAPIPSLFWAACFSFSNASVIKEVPYDPYCPYAFLGEEITMAARLFTHGWDLFHPTFMVVRHKWSRNRPTFWENFLGQGNIHQERQLLEHQSYRRLRNVLQIQAPQPEDLPLTVYGLGTARTLQQYQQYCGVDFLLQKAAPHSWSGVMAQPTPQEIMLKFGSITAYTDDQKRAASKNL